MWEPDIWELVIIFAICVLPPVWVAVLIVVIVAVLSHKAETAHMLQELLCLTGLHRGEWKYESPNQCTQIRICEWCGTKSTQTGHNPDWIYESPNQCAQIRICKRCGAKLRERTRHIWSKRYRVSAWIVRRCYRCGAREEVDTWHPPW